jgi:DNA topoisomerase I
MVQDTQTLCRRHGLTYVESSELGLRRRRCGKGFSYLDPSGRTVRDKAVKARIKALAIPPAWTDVCIAHDGSAHIQAIGRDAEGRLQYIQIGNTLGRPARSGDCCGSGPRFPGCAAQ